MKRPAPRKTAFRLSDSVHQQLSMYALAASAAGVGMLALAQPSEAKIVYTPIHRVIAPNHSYAIDLNHDGKADFNIRNLQNCDSDNTCTSFVSAIRYGANAVEGTQGTRFTPPHAYALKAGARVGRKHPFFGVKMAGAGQTTAGNWYNVANRFLGLRFHIQGQTHYGWARLTVRLVNGFIVTLTGYAYETIPNKPIIAGKTHDVDEVEQSPSALRVPAQKPATLGLLAMGSPGLSIWRRKESALDAE
jgi:hypothetical protein